MVAVSLAHGQLLTGGCVTSCWRVQVKSEVSYYTDKKEYIAEL